MYVFSLYMFVCLLFFLLLFSKMQKVFAGVWDYHIPKPTLLEPKLLNLCPVYNRQMGRGSFSEEVYIGGMMTL